MALDPGTTSLIPPLLGEHVSTFHEALSTFANSEVVDSEREPVTLENLGTVLVLLVPGDKQRVRSAKGDRGGEGGEGAKEDEGEGEEQQEKKAVTSLQSKFATICLKQVERCGGGGANPMLMELFEALSTEIKARGGDTSLGWLATELLDKATGVDG